MSGESKERFFSFAERWETYARELPAEEFQRLVLAACAYSFRGEEPPTDMPLAARMAMVDVKARIDWEREVRQAKQAAGSIGGKASQEKQRQAKTSTAEADASRRKQKQAPQKQTQADESRSQAEASTLKDTGKGKGQKESTATAVRKKADFLSWTPEEFRRQAAAAAEDNPEYREILDEFCAYWLAEDRRGGPHFRHMETWSMAGRLATWRRKREAGDSRTIRLHPAARADISTAGKHTEEIYREEQEAEARRRAQGIDETAELYRAEMEAAGK